MHGFLIILSFILLFLPCGRKNDIEVVSATKQEALPGRQESARAIYYRIRVVAGYSSKKIQIRKFHVDGHILDVRVVPATQDMAVHEFFAGDTLLVASTWLETEQESGKYLPGIMQGKVPSKDGAWLEYKKRKKICFAQIKLTDLGTIIYR